MRRSRLDGSIQRRPRETNPSSRRAHRAGSLGEIVREGHHAVESDSDYWDEYEPPTSDEDWEAVERDFLDAFDDDEPEPELLDELGWQPPREERDDD